MNIDDIDVSCCPLFFGMDKQEPTQILENSVSEVVVIEKGAYLVRQGDSVNYLYLLVIGKVRTEMVTRDGNVLQIDFIESVRPLAPAFIFSDSNKYPVDVIAMNKCTFYLIHRQALLKEMMENEKLMHNFLRINSNLAVFLSNKLQLLSIKSIKGKLALYILENTSAEKLSFTLSRTRTQLAEYFGVQRPSLARSLGELIDDGVISVDKRVLTVVDRAKLERMI